MTVPTRVRGRPGRRPTPTASAVQLPTAAHPDLRSTGSACRRSSPGSASILPGRLEVTDLVDESDARHDGRSSSSIGRDHRRSLVQPTIGSICDYTSPGGAGASRTSSSARSLDVRLPDRDRARATRCSRSPRSSLLLQFSSNFAQGPFQGYVPDLVPAPQVGTGERPRRPDAGPRRRGRLRHRRSSATADAATTRSADDRARRPRARDDAVARLPASRKGAAPRTAAAGRWRSIAAEAWGTDILARAQLPVARRVAASSSWWAAPS